MCVFFVVGFAASIALTCQPPRTRAAPEIARTIAATQRIDIADAASEYERAPKPNVESKAPKTETFASIDLQVFKLEADEADRAENEALAELSEVVRRFIFSFMLATPFKKCVRYSDARDLNNDTVSVARHSPFGQAIFAVV